MPAIVMSSDVLLRALNRALRGAILVPPLVLAVALGLLMCAAARGATVQVVGHKGPGDWDELRFLAVPGERNEVEVEPARPERGSAPWTVHEQSAPLTPGASCTSVDEHTAVCRGRPAEGGGRRTVGFAQLELGDLDDTLTLGRNDLAVVAHGGAGDDVLQAGSPAIGVQGVRFDGGPGADRLLGEVGGDWLDGGPGDDELLGGGGVDTLGGGGGRDHLQGGEGDDTLTDGDRDGGAGDLAPGPDVMGGGRGHDTVSYSRRTAAVAVDLRRFGGNGAPGEDDKISGIEDARGGDGDDVLAGNGHANWLAGNGGYNRLVGRGGADLLMPGPGGGRAACGPGGDSVDVAGGRAFLQPDCETAADGVLLDLPAYPQPTRRGGLRYRARCPWAGPDAFVIYVSCSGTLRIVDTSSRHRLLAHATIPRGRRPRVVPLRLTARGRRLATRRQGIPGVVRVRGHHYPATRWTIKLRITPHAALAGAGSAPPAPVTTSLFTVAGNDRTAAAPDGTAATASGLHPGATLSARAAGGFLVTDRGRVRAVDPLGRVTTVAGTGTPGSGGDGGPARAAQVHPSAVAALPDGGFLLGQCDPSPREPESVPGRVRRVDPDGTITTIAGTGRRGDSRDGRPATTVSLTCPVDVATTPDGSVLISEGEQVRAMGPDGILKTIAGTGEVPPHGTHGGPARQTPLEAYDLAVLADGSTLIADGWVCRVYRLAGDRLTVVAGDGHEGRRSDDGARAVDASVCPTAVAAAPGGGFYVVDDGISRETGSEPRLRYVTPDGRIVTVAGTGRFSPDPSRWDELRGDGMPATSADLRHLLDVAVLTDGGIVFSEGRSSDLGRSVPGLVRFLPAPFGAMLAIGLRRDRDRIFAPGRPAFTTVSLTAPAEVTITVKHGGTVVTTSSHELAAGESRIGLPALGRERYTVELSARDASGRVAADRASVQPRGWLASTLARSLAEALVFSGTTAPDYGGSGVGRCRRFAPGRVDCVLLPRSRYRTVLTTRLAAGQRLRWGTYRGPIARHRRLVGPLRNLRRRDYSCEETDTSCPPPLFGRIADRWLVPWD